jgi:gamma-glutamyltranspeptidase/glutathione hydrolase
VVSPSPMMVFNNNELRMSIGSPAGPWGSTAEVQTILNVLQFEMNMQQAVSVPRIHSDVYARTVYVEPNFPSPYPLENLRKMGHKIVYSEYGGRVSGILRDAANGRIEGGADPRGGGGLAYMT